MRRALDLLAGERLFDVVPGCGRIVKSDGNSPAPGENRAAHVSRMLRNAYTNSQRSPEMVRNAAAVASRFKVSEATAREALRALSDGGQHW